MSRPLLFDQVSDFAEGLAMVQTKAKIGYLDTHGHLQITVADGAVATAAPFSESLALARAGDYYGYLNRIEQAERTRIDARIRAEEERGLP